MYDRSPQQFYARFTKNTNIDHTSRISSLEAIKRIKTFIMIKPRGFYSMISTDIQLEKIMRIEKVFINFSRFIFPILICE